MVELETGLIPFTIKRNFLFLFFVFLLFIRLKVFYTFRKLKKLNWSSINSHWLIIKSKEKIRRHTSSLLLQICMNSVIQQSLCKETLEYLWLNKGDTHSVSKLISLSHPLKLLCRENVCYNWGDTLNYKNTRFFPKNGLVPPWGNFFRKTINVIFMYLWAALTL